MDIKASVVRFARTRAAKAVLVAACIVVVVFVVYRWVSYFPAPDASTYQAVFLSNGQAYFGKMTSIGLSYVRLDDVYYLVANPQSNDASEADRARKSQLVKLGSEVHGPESSMVISKQHILFWENLRQDSQIVKAIRGQ